MFEKYEIPRQRSRFPILIASFLGHALVLLTIGMLYPLDPPSLGLRFVGVVYAGGEARDDTSTEMLSETLYQPARHADKPATVAPPAAVAIPAAVDEPNEKPNLLEWDR